MSKASVHRDLKPSNIFVMDDDAVKIIDFGIVHLVGADSVTGLKGTLQYMAPEQIDLKPSSPASDIFSLAVVCYEALTGRKPFSRKTELETAEAIRHHIPPAICDLNPLVSQLVSRVIHKAMAKDPWHRFSTAKEYSETLQKALRGEALERFDRGKIQPRIDRAKKAQAAGDHQFASEILSELEAEGNIDPEMSLLRIQIDQAIRQKSVRQLLESARTRLEEDEFPLALQKIQEVLAIDPDNPDALSLRSVIEKQRSQRQTENWFRLVDQHIHNGAYGQARPGPGGDSQTQSEREQGAGTSGGCRPAGKGGRTIAQGKGAALPGGNELLPARRSQFRPDQTRTHSGLDAAVAGLDDSRPRCAISRPSTINSAPSGMPLEAPTRKGSGIWQTGISPRLWNSATSF